MNGLLWAAALGVVTAAHYLFRWIAVGHPRAVPAAFGASWALLSLAGYLFLYRVARSSYRRRGGLTPAALFAACCVWGIFFALPSIYGPSDWAWSWSAGVRVPVFLKATAFLLVMAGLAGLLAAFFLLGRGRSLGRTPDRLRAAGPYRFSRNPQLACGALLVLGFVLLRPTAYALGWTGLFAWLAHWMVKAEEEHLRRLFAGEYEAYCARTPRFVGRGRRGNE